MAKIVKIISGIFIAILTAGMIAGFTFIRENDTKNAVQDLQIETCKDDIIEIDDNVDYMQKTLNVTNNTVTEIKVKIEALPTKIDIQELNIKLDRLHRKLDLNENFAKNE